MKRIIYEEIEKLIRLYCPSIKTVRYYQNQDLSPEESLPFATPCVFIGFSDFEYTTQSEHIKYGKGNVELRVCVESLLDTPLSAFDIETEVMVNLDNQNNWGGSIFNLIGDETDESNDSLYVGKLIFETDFYQCFKPSHDASTSGQITNIQLDIDLDKDSSEINI